MVDDFDHARKKFPNDAQLSLIGDAIQLSEDDMIYDPLMFPGQMLDRMAGEKVRRSGQSGDGNVIV